jgi:hypothetical protein
MPRVIGAADHLSAGEHANRSVALRRGWTAVSCEHQFPQRQELPLRTAAWSTNKRLPNLFGYTGLRAPTTLASYLVATLQEQADVIEIPRSLFEHLSEMLAYAS